MNDIIINKIFNRRGVAASRDINSWNLCQFVSASERISLPARKFVDCYLRLSVILLLGVLISCSEEKQENIVAKIGEREISVDEFLNRSELTPRPFYCRSDSEQDKIIILNTLITEKLFALEGQSKSTLLDKHMFKAYIKGRKEQYMREELFNQMAVKESELDSVDISEAFKLAGLVYDVDFYRLGTEKGLSLQKDLEANPGSEDSVFNALSDLEQTPRHTVHFIDPEFPSLHHTLYSKKWSKGEIIGPIRLRETQYMVLRIKNVLYDPAISQTEIVDRRKRVKEKLVEKQTNQRWNQFTASLMKGKKIQFIPDITKKVAQLWIHNFMKDDRIIQVEGSSDKQYGQFVQEVDLLSAETMFKVNNDIWTVADFKNALLSHPLIFRKADLAPSEYLQQFRLAVADLVQDIFITKEAYAQGIDNIKTIKNKVAMWEDAYLALEHRENIIAAHRDNKEEGEQNRNYHKLIEPYIDNLKNKYKGRIEINMELLNKIKLTNTDFISAQQFVPYQQIVPAFPFLTRDDQLGFGSLLN
jgi:hypothetical protein